MKVNIQDSIREVITTELDSLTCLIDKIDENYTKVVELLANCKGKVVFVGVGKSGYIAQKISAMFISIGIAACFLHPTEARHGDLGIVSSDDVVILISNSGESEEIINLIPSLKNFSCPLVAICSRADSSLAQNCDYLLCLPVKKEASFLNIPTTSTTLALVVGDALAVTLIKIKGINKNNFAKLHPAGSLGKRMLLKVEDLMRQGKNNPIIHKSTNFSKIILAISSGMVNAVSVVDDKGELAGLITGYDIRNAFQKKTDLDKITAEQIMNPTPTTFPAASSAYEVLLFMKQNKKPLNVLPIVKGNIPIGMLSLQDLVRAGL